MYELRNPTPELSPWIENYWLVSGPTELSVNVFVDGRADLIFNFGAPYRREIIGSGQRFISESNLDAQRLYPIQIHQQGEVHTVGVRFRLGGLAPFLIPSADSITDKTLPVSLAFGRAAACLERKLRAESDFNAVKCILDEFFLAQRQSDPRLARFQRIMLDAPDFAVRVAVEELSRRYASPARSLERLFARYLGLSPKTLLRILRFQASLRALMRDPGCTLAQLSAELGYYDQAHFVKEFRRMSGGVPRGYRGYFPPQGPDDFAPNVVAFVQDGTDGDG